MLAGHDGTWVAHPGLVEVAAKIFNEHIKGPNQLDKLRLDVEVSATVNLRVLSLLWLFIFNLQDLLPFNVPGKITEGGIRSNISVGLQYMESWLRGVGCVPIHNLMEDAATAEISRSQLWQWLKHGATTAEGTKITHAYLNGLIEQEIAKVPGRFLSIFYFIFKNYLFVPCRSRSSSARKSTPSPSLTSPRPASPRPSSPSTRTSSPSSATTTSSPPPLPSRPTSREISKQKHARAQTIEMPALKPVYCSKLFRL